MYSIDTSDILYKRLAAILFIVAGVIMLPIAILRMFITTFADNPWISALIVAIASAIFVIFGFFTILRCNKRLQKIKSLNQNGKLVKQLPYRIETEVKASGKTIYRIAVDYELSDFRRITLYDNRHLGLKQSDGNKTIDLVIDEQNPNNFFMDFEIDRLSGNHKTDYHHSPNYEVFSK